MEQSSGLGNEQETRPCETDLAYLAGILDGEGSFGINRMNVEGKRHRLFTYLCVANTDASIINKIDRITTDLGARLHITQKPATTFNRKPYWELRTNAYGKITAILEATFPYLAGKKPQAELVLRYIARRSTQEHGRGHKFTEDDLKFYDELKTLNRRGSPETARGAPDDDQVKT